MSNFLIKLALQRKLSQINRVIDAKITHGKTYKKESRLHKSIRQQISILAN